MPGRYHYRHERGWGWRMAAWIAALVLGALLLHLQSKSGANYVQAQYIVIAVCLLALCIMSMPQYILITPHGIEIHCLVEMTTIERDDILAVGFSECSPLYKALPLASGYGLGGYFGYFLSLRRLKLFKLYTTKRDIQHMVISSRYHHDIVIPVLWHIDSRP